MEFYQTSYGGDVESFETDWSAGAGKGGKGVHHRQGPPQAQPHHHHQQQQQQQQQQHNHNHHQQQQQSQGYTSNPAYGSGGFDGAYAQQQQQHHHPHAAQQQSWGPGYQQQPPQQQMPGGFGGGPQNGDFGWSMANQLGMTVAAQALSGQDPRLFAQGLMQQASVNDRVGKVVVWFEGLKLYFRVNNRYVLRKLKILLFPYTHAFYREQCPQPSMEYDYAAPDTDVNGMDLYIPCMALVTYVLLSAAIMGVTKTFTPEVLGTQTSWCIAVSIIEIFALQLFSYSLGATSKLWIVDTACMSGYKYFGICICLLSRYLLPPPFWMVPLAWYARTYFFILFSSLP
ncbi:Protein transport protein yif1 [Diplonema papillatum]|nr:Protein transport protein yif1 [Diplonema papillatum]